MALNREAILFGNTRSGRARSLAVAIEAVGSAGIHIESMHVDLDRETVVHRVDSAKSRGIGLVLCFGGDGTIGSVIDGLVGMDMTLGIIAAGTSNNFARSIGISPGVRGSIDTIVHGQEMNLNIGEANGHYFAHAAIMGMNVDFAREAQRLRGLMGRLSYPLASILVYRSRARFGALIEDESGARQLDSYQLAIMNTPNFAGPLGLELPNAEPSPPGLRILSVHDLRLRTVIRGMPAIFLRRHLGLPGGESFEAQEVTIETDKPMPLTLDGEIRTQTPARIRLVHDAIRVIARPDQVRHAPARHARPGNRVTI